MSRKISMKCLVFSKDAELLSLAKVNIFVSWTFPKIQCF